MRRIIVIAHDVRSSHNIGSLLRTCEGLGVEMVYLTGYTPYPQHSQDIRLPHISSKTHAQITKTALGAEISQPWQHTENIAEVMANLQKQGFTIAALEQSEQSIQLPDYQSPQKIALLLGNEVNGVDSSILAQVDATLEIPMFGAKESFNVTSAASMALYHLRFYS